MLLYGSFYITCICLQRVTMCVACTPLVRVFMVCLNASLHISIIATHTRVVCVSHARPMPSLTCVGAQLRENGRRHRRNTLSTIALCRHMSCTHAQHAVHVTTCARSYGILCVRVRGVCCGRLCGTPHVPSPRPPFPSTLCAPLACAHTHQPSRASLCAAVSTRVHTT